MMSRLRIIQYSSQVLAYSKRSNLTTVAGSSRFISSARHLAPTRGRRRDEDGEENYARGKKPLPKSSPNASSKRLGSNRKMKKSDNSRRRMTPPRYVALPNIGLTSCQLGALAGVSEVKIYQCAKMLEDSVYDTNSILQPHVVDLVTEDLGLNLKFTHQFEPILSPEEMNSRLKDASEIRMPIVTVMGHVDHGKTSLLDALRDSDLAQKEIGGITQSIAAFPVPINQTSLSDRETSEKFATFIDTPGHAAFKEMRANGVLATDIALLVVAADDGVMPQTMEAANLAKSANVPIVIGINKCDRPGADPDKVRYQLLEKLSINTEQLGGTVPSVEISAMKRTNLPELLEKISSEADRLNLVTRSDTLASGVCVESRIDKSLGPVATVVIRMGTLKPGDYVVFQSPRALRGKLYSRVRCLIGSDGSQLSEAGPGEAVGICGIREPIPPGAEVCAVESERVAKKKSDEIVSRNEAAISTIGVANAEYGEIVRKREERERKILEQNQKSMKDKESQLDVETDESEGAEVPPTLTVFIKADVRGSADAVAQCIQALSSADVPVRIIGSDVGQITEKDLQIASATTKVKGNKERIVVIAFNIKAKDAIVKKARVKGIEVLQHKIIYHLEDDVKEVISEMRRSQQVVEVSLGNAEVIRTFVDGSVAGCKVQNGKVSLGDMARVRRLPDKNSLETGKYEVHKGRVSRIQRFAESVNIVEAVAECGISLGDWSGFQASDEIEFFSSEEQS